MTRIITTVLKADIPQRIVGTFTGLKVLEGSWYSYRIFDKDPNQGGDLTHSRRLDHDGLVIVRAMKDPWIMAVSSAGSTFTPPLKLEMFNGPAGLVEGSPLPMMLVRNALAFTADTIGASSSGSIGSTGNAATGIGTGSAELHNRAYWTGFVQSTIPFYVTMRAYDAVGAAHMLVAAESRQMAASLHTLNIDLAAWDVSWSNMAPTTFSAFNFPARLPISHAVKSGLWLHNPSASTMIFSSYVGIRSE